jgi:hypothetical protein
MRVMVLCLLIVLGSASVGRADILHFGIDESQSSVTVTIVGNAPTGTDSDVSVSAMSGELSADIGVFGSPFGTAQVQILNLVLLDEIEFSLSFPVIGGVSIVSDPNNAELISLTSFGPAGNVSGGSFDQLGNVLATQGSFIVNGAGFSDDVIPFDDSQDQDFIGYQLERVGDTVFMSGTFDFTSNFEEGQFNGTLRWQGSFVAFAAVPEPSMFMALTATVLGGIGFRRRR